MRVATDPRLLRDHLGWSHYRIAKYLGVSLSEVRRALDPGAAALNELWTRGSVQNRQRRAA